ncbi:MAG: DMT family transporter [Chitinophagaceae bacterium]|nr:DMT family transporter [Chitinophagaceae bacterium]
MHTNSGNKYSGVLLAIMAVIIWSGNFIIARGVIHQVSPVTLAFYRWGSASVMIAPFAMPAFKQEWPLTKKHFSYLFWVSFFGIALFNTFVYVAGHYTTAINLSLIGTTSSPVMIIIMAAIFLKERIDIFKSAGVLLCITGVLFLLAKGDWHNLVGFRFTKGDQWVLLGAFCFAVYNILVRKKPRGFSSLNFLFVIFLLGSLLLLPFYIWECLYKPPVQWNMNLVLIILFLGLGTSVIAYLCWNNAVLSLGAGRTALFGNLIPVFASIEASFLLDETFSWIHVVSMILVFAGILLANRKIFIGQ